MDNLYYSPATADLVLVASTELSEPCWSFDILAVWANEKGFYLGTDSGCSCPTPFESTIMSELTGPLTEEQALEESRNLKRNSAGPDYDMADFSKYIKRIKNYEHGVTKSISPWD